MSIRSWPGWRVVGSCVLWAPTAAVLCLHLGLVLFERGDFGPASQSTLEVLVFSSAATPAIAAGLPWVLQHHPRLGGTLKRPAMLSVPDQRLVVAMQAFLVMAVDMMVIEPAGGRRVLLSILVPLVGLPLSIVIARWSAARRPPGQRAI